MVTKESDTDIKQFHATLSGRVQGVGFRFFTRREAARLGIKGWVRNLGNGDVEVTAQGKSADLNEFLGKLKDGPRRAHVDDISLEWQSPEEHDFDGFEVRRTTWS